MNVPTKFFSFLLVIFVITALSSCNSKETWLKGNMHTHTFWSDGSDFPESVAKWYKDHQYDFLVFTDHNTLLTTPVTSAQRDYHQLIDGMLWRSLPLDHPALLQYYELFDEDWIETRPGDEADHLLVRLKTLEEFRGFYEEAGNFLLIMGNEITNPHRVHLLAFHQDRLIPPSRRPVEERLEMIRATVNNVSTYREESGRNTHAVLAHPNHGWAITAEMMLNVPDLRFFEVYNGIPSTSYEGDGYRASTDRMWDIVLSNRLEEGGDLLYGLATDDAHSYHGTGSGPGRGWVMVKSEELSPDAILEALDQGDFYASTGVTLKKIQFNKSKLTVVIEPQEGVEYITEYIGTMKGFDPTNSATLDSLGIEIPNTTRTYNGDIGQVLYSSKDLKSSYNFTGKELYVRVKITSTADQLDPINKRVLGKQMAWLQPQMLN
jgi:hypothetical protein